MNEYKQKSLILMYQALFAPLLGLTAIHAAQASRPEVLMA
jgi:hypothetical protein